MTQPPDDQPLVYADPGGILPVAPRARFVRIPMIITLVFSALIAPIFLLMLGPLERLNQNPGAAPDPGAMGGALALICTSCLQFIAFVLTVIFYCMWIFRASNVARRISPHAIHYTPGWAVGWHFIPLANLVMPFLVMREIWQVAHEPEPAPEMTLPAWWGTYVVSGLISSAGSVAGSELFKAFMVQGVLQCVSVALMIVSGILCLKIISQVTQRLDAKTNNLPPDPYPASQPSIFP